MLFVEKLVNSPDLTLKMDYLCGLDRVCRQDNLLQTILRVRVPSNDIKIHVCPSGRRGRSPKPFAKAHRGFESYHMCKF